MFHVCNKDANLQCCAVVVEEEEEEAKVNIELSYLLKMNYILIVTNAST